MSPRSWKGLCGAPLPDVLPREREYVYEMRYWYVAPR